MARRGVRRILLPTPQELPPHPALSHPAESYEGTIAGIEQVLRSKQPRTPPVALVEAWRREYAIRLGPGTPDDPQRSARTYQRHIERFLAWCQAVGLHPLHAAYPELCAYRDFLRDSPLTVLGPGNLPKPGERKLKLETIALALAALTHFYDYLVDVAGLKLRNPARPVLLETKEMLQHAPPKPKRRSPTLEQFRTILENCLGLREIAGFTQMGTTTARNTEFRWVKDSDVYVDERWMRLTPIPKGKRVRPVWDKREAPKPIENSFWVPLTKEAAWVAEKWLGLKLELPEYRRSAFFFPPTTNRNRSADLPIGAGALNDAFQAAVRRSDIPVDWADPRDRLVIHGLRHLATDELEMATMGVDGEARYKDMIDLLRGDSDRMKRSANAYKHIKPHELQAFVDEFSPHIGVQGIVKTASGRDGMSIHDLVVGPQVSHFGSRRVA